ncbi:uncharacterized protein Z518_07209 [Rhinocladiella mackenziei CBS 650.93]|uniref:Protein kinase domain-containing protein n=1 Tax=Rhinocladiella mackenziei CBS 650.93 TaxID=1442369 RepID=A0A0D2IK91_9EURO|nr:uncharacterized protein Z518_07209 [Rhinocladiella mackenziei CBS 650.93]KIX03656.1 hypothetical protein Z518_07209 [Rhinocladiella mackenziei CBS 650.93]
MGSNQAQPTHKAEIQDFIRWIDDNSIQGLTSDSSSAPFMPQKRLTEYIRQGTRLRNLLKELFSPTDPPVHVEPDAILKNCTAVLAILVRIEYGRYIEEFVRHRELFDNHLPFLTMPANFPRSNNEGVFFKKFDEEQWRFCAHIFSRARIDDQISASYILPITSKEKIAEGGTANVFRIQIHPDYDELDPPTGDSDESHVRKHNNTYVLKTFHSRKYPAKCLYKSETAAFAYLKRSCALGNNFIGFHGSFVYNDTYNILLEYADIGSLEDYFTTISPPSTGEDILKLWTSVFGLLTAVENLHTIEAEGNWEEPVWHQDIKPDNILVCSGPSGSPYDFKFKLGDLGLAHFRKEKFRHENARKLGRGQLQSILDKDSGGTKIYGAPECYQGDDSHYSPKRAIGQSVDIWSLGCVFSEVAQWIAQGKEGLDKYRQRRMIATRKVPGHQDIGCFHDRDHVLECVNDTHESLFEHVRVSDVMMKPVIKKMVEEMLYEKEARPNATQLLCKGRKIIEKARRDLNEQRYNESLSQSPMKRPTSAKGDEVISMQDFQDRQGSKGKMRRRRRRRSSNSNQGSKMHSPHDEASFSHPVSVQNPDELPSQDQSTHLSPSPLSPPSRPPKNSKEQALPHMPTDQALFQIISAKHGHENISKECGRLLDTLGKRDHVFLIDDAASMKSHWEDVKMIATILGYFLKKYDDDGMDIYFSSSIKRFKAKTTTQLLNCLSGYELQNSSNVGSKLGEIVTEYIDTIEKYHSHKLYTLTRSRPKPLNIYVLTDGIWQPGSEAETPIRRLASTLSQLNRKQGHVGIQFIFFGEDKEAEERLKRYDSGLGLGQNEDIVDMEPARGNVLKMLVGAVNKMFDDDFGMSQSSLSST